MALLDETPRARSAPPTGSPLRPRRGLRRRWLPTGLILLVLAVLIVLPAAMVLLAAFSVDVPRPGNVTWDGGRRR